MEKIKKRFKDPIFLLWGGCAVFWLVIHALIRINVGDDINFYATAWEKYSFTEYYHFVYNEYSSRIFMWYLNAFLSGHTHIYWRILDTLCTLLSTYLVVSIFDAKHNFRFTLIIMAGWALLPVHFLSSAGWIATTVDYTWPTVCCLYYVHLIVKAHRKQDVRWFEYVICALMLLYGCDMEQLNIIVLGISFLAMAKSTSPQNKDMSRLSYMGMIIGACVLAYILTCPGNASRGWIAEIFDYPGFELHSTMFKVQLGFNNTWDALMREALNILTLWFTVCCCILVFKNSRSMVVRAAGLAPVALTLVFIASYICELAAGSRLIAERTSVVNLFNMYEERAYLRMMVYFAVSGCVFSSVFFAFENAVERTAAVGTLFLGCGVSVASGLSASVYVSYYRTNTYLAIIMMIMCVFMFNRIMGSKMKAPAKIIAAAPIPVLLVLNIINFITLFDGGRLLV